MLEKIKEIVADQLGIDEDDIKLESNFKEDLEADSLDLFELVMALEEEVRSRNPFRGFRENRNSKRHH